MHTVSFPSRSSCLTLLAFLSCSAMVAPSLAHAAIPATTSWAVSRVASMSQGSYCTMAQKFSDETVLTFARNVRGEYSLALDFQDGHFKAGEKQKITLRPEGGAAQTYSVSAQSNRTVVVGIGKDTSLMDQISSTQNLGVEMGGTSLTYALTQFSAGQKELGDCIGALQKTKDKDADLVPSPKTGIASPEPTVKRQVAAIAVSGVSEPSAEGLLAAKPTPSATVSALSSEDVVPVPVVTKNVPRSVAADDKAAAEAAALREENARLSRAMAEQRQAFEDKQAAANGAALDELRQKLEAAQAENDNLRAKISQSSGNADDVAKLSADLQKASQSAQALQAENQTLKNQLASQATVADKANTLSSDVAKANQTLEALKNENATLKNQIGLYQSQQAGSGKVAADAQAQLQANAAALATVQAENEQLKNQLAAASAKGQGDAKVADQLAALTAQIEQQKQASAALVSENTTLKNQIQMMAQAKTPAKADGSVALLQQQIASLQSENSGLKSQLATAARVVPAAIAPAAASSDTDSDALRKEIRELRGKVDTTEAEKVALQNQIDTLQKKSEGAQMKMAGGSWDLEQATRRYQESQREIQRLGSQLQMQQAKCTQEKKDIEYMLFDPAIAKSSQIAMLNSLEDQIAEKDKKMKAMEASLATVQAQASPDKDQKIAALQKQLDVARSDMAAKIQQASTAQDSVIASLKDQLAQKDKAVFDVNAKLADAQNKTMSIEQVKANAAAQEKALASLKAELAQKNQQLADAQTKAMGIEQVKSNATAQEKMLASLKEELAQKNQQLADAQTKAMGIEQVKANMSSQEQMVASLKAELAQKTQQLTEAQSKAQQAGQVQTAAVVSQEAVINTLKTQLAQAQSQLAESRVNAQQVDAKASAQQATTLATLQMQVQQGNQKITELQNQVSSLKTAAMSAAAVAPAAAVVPAPAPERDPAFQNISFAAPKAAAPQFMSIDQFSNLLKTVGVPVRGALQQVKGGDPSSYRAYSWKTDSLYGSVEMRQVSDAAAFDSVIGQYLSRAKSRCSGEFAAVPSQVKASNAAQSKSYEIACVNQSASSSASVLFTYGNNIAMTVAHEGRAEAMDMAMDARDRISSQIR